MHALPRQHDRFIDLRKIGDAHRATRSHDDVEVLRERGAQSESGDERKRVERAKLDALLGYAESTTCRRQRLLAYFGETLAQPCGNCDNCLDPPQTWDGTVAAQKALSCVIRTGQRYGVGHLVNVLRGDADERVTALRHDALSTFGIGKDLDERQWRSVFRQLVAAGYLATDDDGFGVLRLTAASRGVLRGETTVQLRRVADRDERRASRKSTRAKSRQTGELVTEVHVASFLESFNFHLRCDLIDERLQIVVRERRHVHTHEFAVNAEHGRIAGREMKVRGVLFLHEFEKGINASHGSAARKLVRCQ